MKPSLFIGSSSEAAHIAEALKKALLEEFDCEPVIWSDDGKVFLPGSSTFDSIINAAHFFDYSILILSEDDLMFSRGNVDFSPRDNVLLELGLFVGSQGKMRSFMVVAESGKGGDNLSIKLPSDLNGENYLPLRLTKRKARTGGKMPRKGQVEKVASSIAEVVRTRANLSFLSPLPSTILASTYYTNFLLPTCERILKSTLMIDGIRAPLDLGFDEIEVTVAVPRKLKNSSKAGIELYKREKKLLDCRVKTETRPFPFYVRAKKVGRKYLFHDVPTILQGSREAIELLMPNAGFIGKTKEVELLEKREVQNFIETLRYLISEKGDGVAVRELIKVKSW